MKGRKIIKKIVLIVGLVLFGIFAINWLMTFRLEDTLRNRLRDEVIKATDGFYDCSFDEIHVDLFTGELMLKGLALFPDRTSLLQSRRDSLLPSVYLDLYIDTIDFRGVNLTWLFNYRKLSFEEFLIKSPSIKIFSPKKDFRAKSDSLNKVRSFHESVSSFFDVVQAKYVSFKSAEVRYEVEDLVTVHYSLRNFDFTAYNFVLDDKSQERGNLLLSEDFRFKTSEPQVIFDSDRFLFNIHGIELSTIDSLVHVQGTHFITKDEYWNKKQLTSGSYNDIEVEDFKIEGIQFRRKGAYNLLDAKRLAIYEPSIEYQTLSNGEVKVEEEERHIVKTPSSAPWSLYAVVRPILESIKIDEIDIEKAHFKYTRLEDDEEDEYILNRLDFKAYGFVVDSLHQDYHVVNYVNDFELDAIEVEGNIPSKNILASIGYFHLSTLDKTFTTSDVLFSPISVTPDKEHIHGEIKSLEVTNINYDDGLKADLLHIDSPLVNYISSSENKKVERKNDKKTESKILEAIIPFIKYVSVKDISINNANATFTDRKTDNKYTLRNLDFQVKNFFVDEHLKNIKDYLFNWDEYKIRFEDFDNLTPDKKYRIKIASGDFNSVSGNVLIKSLNVIPRDTTKGSYMSLTTPYVALNGFNQEEIKNKKILFEKFIVDSPILKLVNKRNSKGGEGKTLLDLEQIRLDSLQMTNPSVLIRNEQDEEIVQLKSFTLDVDSLFWQKDRESFSMGNLNVQSPYVSVVSKSKEQNKEETTPITIKEIFVKQMNLTYPKLELMKDKVELDLSMDRYFMNSLFWDRSENSFLDISNLDIVNPNITLSKRKEEQGKKQKGQNSNLDRLKLGRLNVSSLNLVYNEKDSIDQYHFVNKLTNTSLLIEAMDANFRKKDYGFGELAFKTKDINYPVSDGFYTWRIKEIDFSKKRGELLLNDIKLVPAFPKFDFSYIHPKGADWFDVEVDQISLSGLDFSRFKEDSVLRADKFNINHVVLQNLKNQKIEVEHRLVPLFYEQFQHFPIKYYIKDVEIKDFTVIYEELPKNGSTPLRIPFVAMNGEIKDFTNVQKEDGAFYTLRANGLALGRAPFNAEWKMPVDTTNDQFYFMADIRKLDLKDANQIVVPSAPAYIKNGYAERLCLTTDANSKKAVVELNFEYDSLDLIILKRMGDSTENKFLTKIVNRLGVERSNKGDKMRIVHDTIVRDPYHSNFNYFWQMLRPTMTEAVGVTEEKRNIMYNLNVIAKRIKDFFRREKKDKK